MRKKFFTQIFFAINCLFLSSCSAILQESYSSVTVHTVAPRSEEDSQVVMVESYYELVNALLYYFVNQHEEFGQIRLVDYDKSIARADMTSAVQEILRDTALGSYGVNSIDWEMNSILGNLEVEIQVDYGKTLEEFQEIIITTGSSVTTRAISLNLSEMSQTLVLQNVYSTTDRAQLSSMLQQAFALASSSMVEIPEIHSTFYPKEGAWRILELQFQYNTEESLRLQQQEALKKAIESNTSQLWSSGEEDLFQTLLTNLSQTASYSTRGDTAYDVLVNEKGNSRGFAMTFQALCQELGLISSLIEGKHQGETHYWNLITTAEGETYHVDIIQELNGTFHYFSDAEFLALGYEWTKSTTTSSSAPQLEIS